MNAAGILTSGGIENLSIEDYDKQMNVNARALFITTQAAVPHLKVTKGSIVNVSSVTGLRAVSFLKAVRKYISVRMGEFVWKEKGNLIAIMKH